MENRYWTTKFPGVCAVLASFTEDFTGQDTTADDVAEEMDFIFDDDESLSDDEVLTAYVERRLGYTA